MSQQQPHEGEDTVLIPREAAALLGVSVDDLLDAARRGDIPAVRLGDIWRFSYAKVLATEAAQAVLAA